MRYAGDALAIHFKGRGFVATDLLVYYREGDKRARVAPDEMVVLGVDGSHRGNYRIWAEGGRAPDFVLEFGLGLEAGDGCDGEADAPCGAGGAGVLSLRAFEQVDGRDEQPPAGGRGSAGGPVRIAAAAWGGAHTE